MLVQTKALLLFVMIAAVTAVATTWPAASFAADKYSGLSNNELQNQALRLVKKLRDLVYSYNDKDKDSMVKYQADYLATRTTERQAVSKRWREKSDEAVRSSVHDYQKNFLADAVALRDELNRRLPKQMHRPGRSDVYKNPPNVLAIDAIADHLELLAKSLPAK